MRYVDRFANRKGNLLSKSSSGNKQNTEIDDETCQNDQYSFVDASNISRIGNKNPFSGSNGQDTSKRYTEVIFNLENELQIARAETVHALNLMSELGYNDGIKNDDVEKIHHLALHHLSKDNKSNNNPVLSVGELWLLYKKYPLEELLHKLSQDILKTKCVSNNVQGT